MDSLKLSDEILETIGDKWLQATSHIFIENLCSDVLNDTSWRKYLIQDYAFVEALTGLVKTAVVKSPGNVQRKVFEGFLSVLTGAEDQFFVDAFQKAEIPASEWSSEKESEVTMRFIDLFDRAGNGSYGDVLSVLLPVEWVYLTWATNHKSSKPRDSYNEWILLHNNEEFTDFVMFLKSEFDEVGDNLSEEYRARMAKYFSTACELEILFFDHCYV